MVTRWGWPLILLGLALSQGTACQSTNAPALRVGVTPVPHEALVRHVLPQLQAQGVRVKVVSFNDYTQPNIRLAEGDLDVNFYQTDAYLRAWADHRGAGLVSVGKVHVEPFGLYSSQHSTLDALPHGATVALPSEVSNHFRGLNLLARHGLVRLRDDVGLFGTTADVVHNPRSLKFVELDAAMLARAVNDVDLAGINANYALLADLTPEHDALARESADSAYANVVVVRPSDAQKPEILALVAALRSDSARAFMEKTYRGAVLPAF